MRPPRWLQRAAPDVLGLAALLLLVSKLAWRISTVRDLPLFSDDSWYEARGVRLLWAIRAHAPVEWPSADWAPLYTGSYAALGTVCADPVRLFDLHWTALVGATSLGLYGLARQLGQPVVVSVIAGAGPLATTYFHMPPFPGHLYCAIALAACLAACACNEWHARWCILVAAFALAAFVRPEASFGLLVAMAALVVATARRIGARAGAPRVLLSTAAALVVPVALLTAFGNPLAGTRGFDAFKQHYAFTITQRDRLSGDPWMNPEWILRRDFGSSASLAQVFAANPRAMLAHVLHDACEVPGNILDLCALRTSVTSASSVPWQAVSAVLLAACALALGARLWRVPRSAPRVSVVAVVFGLVCVSTAPGALLVFPRAHYFVAPCALGWLLAITSIGDSLRSRYRALALPTWLVPGVVALVLGLLVPAASTSQSAPQPLRRAVAALRALAPRPTTALAADVDLPAFAGYDYPAFSGWNKDVPLLELFAREGTGLASFELPTLGRDAFAKDPQVAAFLEDPRRFGFCEVHSDPLLRLFVRPDVLPLAQQTATGCIARP